MTLLIYTTIGIYFNHILGGVCGEARAPPPPRPFQQACRSRASRCRWWPSWWPAAGFLLRAGGLRHPWVSPCLGRGRLAVVLPAEARGVAVAPRQGAREGVYEVGCEVGCDGLERGQVCTMHSTQYFSRHPHSLGRLLTGAHALCCLLKLLAMPSSRQPNSCSPWIISVAAWYRQEVLYRLDKEPRIWKMHTSSCWITGTAVFLSLVHVRVR